jgi:exoribonuclease II
MNLQSEVDYFAELRLLDKARLLATFLTELATEARSTYGASVDSVHDGARLRFVNELVLRLTRLIEQILAEDHARPADDVVIRMLLSPRADKIAERLVHNAYRRALQNFERYDTTVLMNG